MEYIERMCRICCSNNNNNDNPESYPKYDGHINRLNDEHHQRHQMFPIFETHFQGNFLVDLMRACCPRLAIIIGDNLPKNICNYCMDLLIKFYKFQLLCIETDKRLRQSIKTETTSTQITTKQFALAAIDEAEQISSFQEKSSLNTRSLFEIQCDNKCSGKENDVKQELINHYNDITVQDKNCIKLIHEETIFVEQLENIHDEKNVIKIKDNDKDNHHYHYTIIDGYNHLEAVNIDKCDDSSIMGLINENLCLENDYKLKIKDKRFECDICKFRFYNKTNMKKHLNKHIQKYTAPTKIDDNPKSFKCKMCTKEFNKQLSLSSHMRIHKNIVKKCNKFECDICSKIFPRLHLLKSHIKIHDKTLRKCTICDVWFISAQKLIRHMKMHRRDTILSSYVCPICQKSYKYSSTLKVHLLSHESQKSYLCAKCGKGFDTNSNLHQHSIVHKDAKPFACSECPKQFKFKGKLTSHMVTHSGVRPYVCDICYSSFTAAYSLKIHKRIHTGERPHSCKMCNMRFNSTGQLQCHIRTHTGEKPYKCKYCERAFAQSYDLVKHTRSHIGDKTYQCTQCTAAFRLQSELRVHVAMHYQEEHKIGGIKNDTIKQQK